MGTYAAFLLCRSTPLQRPSALALLHRDQFVQQRRVFALHARTASLAFRRPTALPATDPSSCSAACFAPWLCHGSHSLLVPRPKELHEKQLFTRSPRHFHPRDSAMRGRSTCSTTTRNNGAPRVASRPGRTNRDPGRARAGSTAR